MVAQAEAQVDGGLPAPAPGSLVVVGGGVLGVLTAYYASAAGHAVTLVAAGAEPKAAAPARAVDPRAATFAGEDMRFVSLLEGRTYLGPAADPLRPDHAAAFARPVHEGGWLDRPLGDYDAAEQAWLLRRAEHGRDAAAVARLGARFVSENLTAQRLWIDLLAAEPELAATADVRRDGILRLYRHPQLLDEAEQLHRQHGALLGDRLDAAAVAALQPALAAACREGACVGGLRVDGLAFRAQTLVRGLLDRLRARGGRLRFGVELAAVERDEAGQVRGLRSADGELLQARHYALCVGAYDAPGLLRGLGAADEIMAVLGLWVRLPAPPGLSLPLKLQGTRAGPDGGARPIVDLNLHVLRDGSGPPLLCAGGGYLFAGSARRARAGGDPAARAVVQSELHAMLDRYLGEAYRAARARGELVEGQQPCLRSFTADDLELWRELPARGPQGAGRLVLVAGGNTGTTAKAPLLARQALVRLSEHESA
ncbi:MAG: FAD-dependent oxidoreductase [Polyangia bacterium]